MKHVLLQPFTSVEVQMGYTYGTVWCCRPWAPNAAARMITPATKMAPYVCAVASGVHPMYQ